jgi:hypothetical protein
VTLNVDPVTATFVAIGVGLLLKVWKSIGAKIKENHESAMGKLDDYHAENKEKLKELTDERNTAHDELDETLDEHGKLIVRLRGDVDLHGYRLTAAESAIEDLQENDPSQ